MKTVKQLIWERFDQLMGGIGDDITPKDVDADEFDAGEEVEMEHTDDPEIAGEIALDHLSEDPEYYIKLYQAGLIDEPSAREKIQQMIKQKGIK